MRAMDWHKLDVSKLDFIEQERLLLQQELDDEKSQEERNKLGQFATPTKLSIEILNYAKNLIPDSEEIRFLDPAFGTGSFYSALLRSFPGGQIERACGYEIDHHYGISASKFWNDKTLDLRVVDFTKTPPPPSDNEKFNLVICNPPYVRHHHLTVNDKTRLRQLVISQTNYRLNGLAGLYCYFLLLTQSWMSPNGLAGWLIPSEFLEVKYGNEVKQFLLKNVSLLHIHRFKPKQTQFEDALVSSVVVWFRQENRPAAPILCTYMGRFSKTHDSPFRFILNHSQATAPNVYLLLYPRPTLTVRLKNNGQLLRSIWQALRQIAPTDLIAEGRVYGGGLHKIEPNELANAKIRKRDIFELSESADRVQLSLF